jgi:hypothetical protein
MNDVPITKDMIQKQLPKPAYSSHKKDDQFGKEILLSDDQ